MLDFAVGYLLRTFTGHDIWLKSSHLVYISFGTLIVFLFYLEVRTYVHVVRLTSWKTKYSIRGCI